MLISRATLHVPPPAVDDLAERLGRTRWPTPWPAVGNDERPDPGQDNYVLRRLAKKWSSEYSWRTHEAAINAMPSYTVDIAGTAVHFLRYDGEGDDPLPIVVTHGWPSSFLEMPRLARRLSTPSRYGRLADRAFTVVVPSLPGFGMSAQRPQIPAEPPTHELWHRLMHDALGFRRYGAHGGDLGAGITSLLAQSHPESVVGAHLLAVADPLDLGAAAVADDEQRYLDASARWFESSGGYEHEQMTRPLTLSHGLSDSPVGLLAWLVEKYREWSDCDGDVSRCFSDDFLLTQASLYWFTETISTSFRPYFEYAQGWGERVQQVTVPTALAVFPKDLVQPPRSWAERTHNVTRYSLMPHGGHFAAHEQPDLLARDITEFFAALR